MIPQKAKAWSRLNYLGLFGFYSVSIDGEKMMYLLKDEANATDFFLIYVFIKSVLN